MKDSSLWRKSRAHILAMRKHKHFSRVAGFVIFALFFLYSIFFKLSIPGTMPERTELPNVATPDGVLTLITEPAQGMAPVFDLIQSATSSIDLVMYEFKDKEIGDALIAAKERGVAVRVLVDHGYYGKADGMNDSAYAYLQAHNIPVEWTSSQFALTHQKTLIIDAKKALIMTFNFTPQYYATSRDFGVLDTDVEDVAAIEKTFDSDWKNKNTTAELGTDLVWSPGSEGDMTLIISQAKKTLDVYNEEMQDSAVIDALSKAAKRGVAVRVVMTYTTALKSTFNQLIHDGITVKTFGGGKHTLYIHAKVIIADGTEAFLGSENFSPTSLGQNRELGLFITNKNILDSLENVFDGDFMNARVYTVK